MDSAKFPYWIVALGDIEPQTSSYPWAVVSDPLGIDLFILARDVAQFESQYETAVLELVGDRGFRFEFNKPIKTYQSSDCVYPTPPAVGSVKCY